MEYELVLLAPRVSFPAAYFRHQNGVGPKKYRYEYSRLEDRSIEDAKTRTPHPAVDARACCVLLRGGATRCQRQQ